MNNLKSNKYPFKRKKFYRKRNKYHQQSKVYASIDLGTTNCRLLIATETENKSFLIKEAYSKITRLGEGVISTGLLADRTMKKTISVLKTCARKISYYKPVKMRFVATEACRRASNSRAFVEQVKKETGIDFEIISFEEECRLGVSGCLPLFRNNTKYALVFDIGGGSTEISFAKIESEKVKLASAISIPYGVVTVSEAFTGKGLSYTGYRAVADKIKSYLVDFDKQNNISELIKNDEVQVIAMSGTVTTIGAFHLKLPVYSRRAVDGLTLSVDELMIAKRYLEKMTYQEKFDHPCIGPQRADLTLPGCAILQGICEMWPFAKVTIADRGLREGLILDLIANNKGKADEC
ncbi:MAG: Ppx/GppA family phosphatase [Alphaproteobacteria bacterium]|nr:Ppx/GppA family phosphatase [Alphaproteobacteria bacterium]